MYKFEYESNVDISELEETAISSQALVNTNRWEILKEFIKKSELKSGINKGKSKSYKYVLLKCKKCGHLKLAAKTSLYKDSIECSKCYENSIIGQTFGCYKVIAFDHYEERRNRKFRYYKVQCINCGRIYIKEQNLSQWKLYTKCSKCDKACDDSVVNSMYYNYKRSAKQRSIEWNLSLEEFIEIIHQECHYCGESPTVRKKGTNESEVNGIDRIDSSKGYTKENCVPCCSICNYMKLNYDTNFFYNHISKIYKYHIKEGSTTIPIGSTFEANANGNGDCSINEQ